MKHDKVLLMSCGFLLFYGCDVRVTHESHPRFDTCDVTYDYYRNGPHDPIEPVVSCVVSNASSNSHVVCSMSFQANNLPIVSDTQTVFTDIYGYAVTSVWNGNCFYTENIRIEGHCIVNGIEIGRLDTGRIPCGQ